MTQPTHFTEVWKTSEGILVNEKALIIKSLDSSLRLTKEIGGVTIAVWKIYPKK